MGEPWAGSTVKSNIVGEIDPCFGDHRYPTLQYVYRVVTRYWKGVIKHILKPFISSVRSHEPPFRADANVDSTDATARRCCGVGVRVSAPLRRGAAPYGDGSLCSQAPSHLISLSILGVPEEFRPEFYIKFCVRQIGTKSPSWSTSG